MKKFFIPEDAEIVDKNVDLLQISSYHERSSGQLWLTDKIPYFKWSQIMVLTYSIYIKSFTITYF